MLGSSIQLASPNTLSSTAAVDVLDNIVFTVGTDSDIAIVNRSTILNANTGLASVLIGTPVAQAIAANTLMVSNVTASGDIAAYVNKGGASQMVFWADGSTGDTAIMAASGQSVDVYIAGVKEYDFAADTFVIGSGDGGVTAAGNITIRPPNLASGAGTDDVAGADFYIKGALGRGSGGVGQIIFQTAQVAAADTVQTYETILTLDEDLATFAKAVSFAADNTWTTAQTGLTLTSPTINGTIATTGLTLPAVTLGGTLTLNSQIFNAGAGTAQINTTGTTPLTIQTTSDAAAGARLVGKHISASPATNDELVSLRGVGLNDGAGETILGNLGIFANSVAAGAESTYIQYSSYESGGWNTAMTLSGAGALWTDLSVATRTLILGAAGTIQGSATLAGLTSGVVTLAVGAAAGTWTMTLPAAVGTAGYFLVDAAGNGVTSWSNSLPAITLTGAVAGGDQAFTGVGDMTFTAGSIIRSGSTNGDTLILAANDTTFITFLTAATDVCTLDGITLKGTILADGTVTMPALTLNGDMTIADTIGICTGLADDDYFLFKADDRTVGLVEVGRVSEGTDPWFQIGRDDTGVAVNAITDMLVLQAGAGANNESAGFGLGISFKLGNAASEVEERVSLDAYLATATNGAEAAYFILNIMTAGAMAKTATWSNRGVTAHISADSVLVADEVTLGAYELSAGNRALAISQEAAVAVDVDETKFSHKMPVRINGATYYMMLTAT